MPAPHDQDTIESLLFLAEYFKNNLDFARSENYCNRLLDIGGPDKEVAKALLKEIRQLKASGSSPHNQSLASLHGDFFQDDSFSVPQPSSSSRARTRTPLTNLSGPRTGFSDGEDMQQVSGDLLAMSSISHGSDEFGDEGDDVQMRAVSMSDSDFSREL